MISTSIRLAARNTLRRRVRTALTAGMVMLGVALLMIALSWIGGALGGALENATAVGGHVRVVDTDFARREVLMPLEENLPDVAPLVEKVRSVPGVVAAEPRLTTGVTVTVGEEIGDVFGLAVGANLSYFERLGLRDKLAKGSWFSGKPDELILGAKVAEQTGAKIGDEVLLLGVTQDGSMSPIKGTLIAIVSKGTLGVDQQILLPLEKLQWLTDIPNGATEVLAFGEDYKDADALAATIRAHGGLGEGLVAQSWSERDPWKSLGETMKGVQSVIMFVIIFLAALGIWNTMMMSVLERTSEIGVLRAMGLSRLGAVGLFVGEAIAIGVAGGLLGIALGSVPAMLLEKYGIHIGERVAATNDIGLGETIRGDLTLEIVILSFSLGLLMAVLGSLLPSLRAASIQPVTAMRSGR